MKLIIGGAYQGKTQYALDNYAGASIETGLHITVLELLKNGQDPVKYMQQHISDYADKIIICDDISCGVIPVDPLMRQWREALGHTLAFLTKESNEVVRVFCGIGTRLK